MVSPLTTEDITCFPLRTDNPVVSNFNTTAEPLLGRIYDAVQRTFENNMMSIQSGPSPPLLPRPHTRSFPECMSPRSGRAQKKGRRDVNSKYILVYNVLHLCVSVPLCLCAAQTARTESGWAMAATH